MFRDSEEEEQVAQKRPNMILSALLCCTVTMTPALAQSATPTTPPSSGAQGTATSPTLDAARAALNAKQYTQARALFESLVAARYDDPEAHFGLGLTLYALGDLPGARFEFQQLIKLAPERYEGYFNLGVVAARAGNHDEALANYNKALELATGKAPEAAVRQVLDAITAEQERRRDYAGLVNTLTAMLKLTPTDERVRLQLATAIYRAGNGPDALPLAYAVLQADSQNADAAILVADIYAAQQLPERAIRELDKAIGAATVNAAKARLLLRKAELQRVQNRARDAVETLRQAVTLDPGNARVYALLGDALTARADRNGALAAWRNAVRLDPGNAVYRATLAATELALGQYDAARANANRAARDTDDPATLARVQLVMGVAAYRQGKYAEARTTLQSAALKSPTAETYLWLGLSAYALGDYAGAVTALEASVKASPTVTARVNLGAALLQAGRYQEAEATLRGVVKDNPRNAEAWYHLGWSLRSQGGRESEARQAFRTSLNLGYTKARGALQ